MPSSVSEAANSSTSGGGDDALASSDEIKVFDDEGGDEERSSENLTDLKSSLITEGEGDKASSSGSYPGSGEAAPSAELSTPADDVGKPRLLAPRAEHPIFGLDSFGYPGGWALGGGMGKMGVMSGPTGGSPLSGYFPIYAHESLSQPQPPPAHMGISVNAHIDGKSGIRRPAVYSALGPQYPQPPMYNTAFTQLPWPMYPSMSTSSFRSYGLSAGIPGLTPSLLSHPAHPGHGIHNPFSQTAPVIQKHSDLTSALNDSASSPLEQTALSPHESDGGFRRMAAMYSNKFEHCAGQAAFPVSMAPSATSPPRRSSLISSQNSSSQNQNSAENGSNGTMEKKSQKPSTHVKKPLNAFMLYMKEMRAKVVAECTLKESAAINQILGRRWHSLTREQQQKYYEMAKKERQLHMQLYPGWTARDNYALNTKKKKKKKERIHDAEFRYDVACGQLPTFSSTDEEKARRISADTFTAEGHLYQLNEQLNHNFKKQRLLNANNVSNSAKKCRARYGLDQQTNWCKPCRRKKKCVRYREGEENPGSNNPGSNAPSSNGPFSIKADDCDDDDDSDSDEPNISSVEAPTPPDSVRMHRSPGAQSLCTDDEHPLLSPLLPMPPSPRVPLPLPTSHKNHPLSIHQLTSQSDFKREPQDHQILGVESILTPPSTETPHLLTVT